MKTSVIMTRPMSQFKVEQRTKDGMFNATSLLKQWNEGDGNKRKDLNEFLGNKTTQEFIQELTCFVATQENNLSGISDKTDSQVVSNITLVASEKNVLCTVRKRKGMAGRPINEVWMHPYLFIDFAMWLNPKFKVQVIKFVYDELIKLRCDAGDNYKLLSASASIFPDVDYARIGKGLNYIVFGKHYDNIRQTATNEQLKELNKVQEQLAFSVDMGLVTSFQGLITVMQNMYTKKWVNI